MQQWMRTLFALPVLCAAGTASTPLSFDEIDALADRQNCDSQGAGRIVFAGKSELLGACLERLGNDGPIHELRITSGGGDAWVTLETARSLRGRLDLIVVDGLCASSCANYLLPAAQRVRVIPHSYVLLHGSMSLRLADSQQDAIRQSIREQMRAQPMGKDMPEAEIEKVAQQAIDTLHHDLEQHVPVQKAFARDTLTCDDWLDVEAHHGGKPLPAGMYWLLVTPRMAARCLKTAKIDAFWAPEAQQAFDPKLGFLRALK